MMRATPVTPVVVATPFVDEPAARDAPPPAPPVSAPLAPPVQEGAGHESTDTLPDGTQPKAVSPMEEWLRAEGYWYITSAVVHAIAFVILAILATFLPNSFYAALGLPFDEAPTFEATFGMDEPELELEHYPVGDAPLDPSTLDTQTLTLITPPSQTARHYDDSEEFELAGGGRGSNATGPLLGGLGGPMLPGVEGVAGLAGAGESVGTGNGPGSGGSEIGFGGRGKGHRAAILGSTGGTKQGERAVGAALNWLARHQAPAGNWSLQFSRQCVSAHGCGGQGTVEADAGATALALLPFLGAGQTHKSKGPYQRHISKGIAWLVKHQAANGDLAAGAKQRMYSHGLAAIALCEAYGMTGDSYVGDAASKSLRFIEQAQNPETGGWRYQPGDLGDTSVMGWQVMALKSGQMAGLGVNTMVLETSDKWLRSVASGHYSGLYCYLPEREVSPAMTAVGMLCRQYLEMRPDTPAMREGKEYLLAHLPDTEQLRDVYYWYYATLVMHNFLGPDWDNWNRKMRRTLITTQCREGCAEGSWDPDQPAVDKWGGQGGRLYMTSLSALTLEVYYRYLPLFQVHLPPPPRM